MYYYPELELMVASDALAYRIGAVLSHKMSKGEERPVAFASESLTAAERNYLQVDKEALACIFAVKMFHVYICG